MKNKLSDLNNHLFAQLERLADEGLTGGNLEQEIKRGEAVAKVADQIVRSASVQLQAAKLVSDHGFDPTPHLPEVVGKPAPVKQVTDRRQ